jgi:hypothetical protein
MSEEQVKSDLTVKANTIGDVTLKIAFCGILNCIQYRHTKRTVRRYLQISFNSGGLHGDCINFCTGMKH